MIDVRYACMTFRKIHNELLLYTYILLPRRGQARNASLNTFIQLHFSITLNSSLERLDRSQLCHSIVHYIYEREIMCVYFFFFWVLVSKNYHLNWQYFLSFSPLRDKFRVKSVFETKQHTI